MITLTDGLIFENSWYKHELKKFIEDEQNEAKKFGGDVRGVIFAQLTGQTE